MLKRTEVEEVVQDEYACEHCDLVQDVDVDSWGMSVRVFGDAADGEREAREDAEERARDTLAFVPCPSCGRRSSERREVLAKTVTSFVQRVVVLTVVAAFVLWTRGEEGGTFVWMTAAIGGAMLLLIVWALLFGSKNPWSRPTERVRFLGEAGRRSGGAKVREQRRENQAELSAMRRKVLYALGAALAVGAVVAVVLAIQTSRREAALARNAARPEAPLNSAVGDGHANNGARSNSSPHSNRGISGAAGAVVPSDAQLTFPLRHQLEIDGKRIDVTQGTVELGRYVDNHILITPLWGYHNDDLAFVHPPQLTTIVRRDNTVVVYGDNGCVQFQWFDRKTELESIGADKQEQRGSESDRQEPPEPENGKPIFANIGSQQHEGVRRLNDSGDTLDHFVLKLDRLVPMKIWVRRTAAETPSLDRALASLTTAAAGRRSRYKAISGDDVELFEDEPAEVSGVIVTLRRRPTQLRLIDGWRIAHPADVVIMRRTKPEYGPEVIFERDGIELVAVRRPNPPSSEDALQWLHREQGTDAAPPSEQPLIIAGKTHTGLRRVQGDDTVDALGLKTASGGVAALVRYRTGQEKAAHALMDQLLSVQIAAQPAP